MVLKQMRVDVRVNLAIVVVSECHRVATRSSWEAPPASKMTGAKLMLAVCDVLPPGVTRRLWTGRYRGRLERLGLFGSRESFILGISRTAVSRLAPPEITIVPLTQTINLDPC